MTVFKRFGFLLVCTAVAFLVSPQRGFAQADKVTYDEYKTQLAGYEQRTAEAKRSLMECQQAGEDLSKQISDLDAQIATVQNAIYKLVDSDEAGVNAYLAELDKMESRLTGMLSLSDAQLFDVRDEFDGITARVKEMKKSKISVLPVAQKKFASIDQLIERITSRMPAKRIKPYTVLKNDSLWKIAKKPEIYSNPYLWPRIYLENRDKIKDPNVIYPKWVLNVPFGVDRNQHLVLPGQNLSKIAAIVYKDPTKWHRLYQANQNQILEPNLIFPAQVLDVPAN
jgi:nucleoid-associated protein YgaU